MPTLIGPAVDPTLSPASMTVLPGSLTAPIPSPPVDGPGDPDIEYDSANPVPQVVTRVLIGRRGEGTDREVIGCLETAVVDDYDEDVELLQQTTAAITVDADDPLFKAIAEHTWIGSDGWPVYDWNPKRYIVWVEEDGVRTWTGVLRAPVALGGGKVQLQVFGPQVILSERILGRAEQLDLLGDKGSFENYSNQADMEADGWVFPAGCTATIVTDGVRGTKALNVTGGGDDAWVKSPRVILEGADGYSRTVEGATFGAWGDLVPSGAVVSRTWAQRTDSLAPSNPDASYESAGVRPDDSPGFTGEPITSGARMSAQVVPHRCWTEVRSFDGVNARYDLVTLRQGVTTGFPPGSDQDYVLYIERIIRDLNSTSVGGHDTGLRVDILSPTGHTPPQAMRWNHNQRVPVADPLRIVLDADHGPEAHITPDWRIQVTNRLGSDRADIGLSNHDVVSPSWEINPAGQIEEFVADTGRGTGTSWISATISQTVEPDRWRSTAIVQAPPDRTLNEVTEWARRHARVAARLQVSAVVVIPWTTAAQIALGDSLWCTFHDGTQGLNRRLRVLNKRKHPADMTVTLTLGEHGA